MRILGIDPGLRLTGYGCVDACGLSATLVEAGVFRLARGGSKSGGGASLSSRLVELDTDFRAALERLRPELVAIEGLFAHYKHPATAITMGHARGVLMLAVQRAGLPLIEMKPRAVKKSLTGFGGADKVQMQRAIQAEFALPEPPSPPDVADALAIALCALRRHAAGAVGLSAARR
ncbi:MAG: Holliday junction resolvase [Tepidisphaera sp.]|nr:Holliday junction resolvase [Tepidisphaera sp.]